MHPKPPDKVLDREKNDRKDKDKKRNESKSKEASKKLTVLTVSSKW